ncbi:MAG: ribonuclease Z [Candidatus Aenigmarchaeota archaeon]|nr:ribonuclease Z [Candidatus Aenigmarchaeota archaeon]
MIIITFLGTVSGVPTKNRNHPAIALEYFSKKRDLILWDCGEGTQKRLMDAGISFMDIKQIYITHWHADHFSGLLPLIATMNLENRRKSLEIFGPEAAKFVKLLLSLGYYRPRFEIRYFDVDFKANEVSKIFETRDYEIFSIPVKHTVPTVAYALKEKDRWRIDLKKLKAHGLKRGRWLKVLKEKGIAKFRGNTVKIEEVGYLQKGIKIVYSGDTKPCKNMITLAKDADVLIHDATFLEEDERKYHTDVKQAARIAKKADAKVLILTHLSRKYQDASELEKEARKVFEKSFVAYDLMKIRVDKEGVKLLEKNNVKTLVNFGKC